MSLNIAACVILYNPKKEDLQNITSYLSKVNKLYIYDNSATKLEDSIIHENKKIVYFWDGENQGISIRLNQAARKAIYDGYDKLLTMDQDSSFLEKNIAKYFSDIENFKETENVANFGLEYSKTAIACDSDEIVFEEVDHLITSCSVINLDLFEKIGGFDENLFIDGVDIDYCYAALKNGFKNIQFKNNYFKHSLGEPIRRASITSLYLIKKNRVIHSNLRVYYMYRNVLYLEKKYGTIFPEITKKLVKDYLHHIKRCIRYSENIIKAYKYKFKAYRDFKNNRMGKIN
jgi:rhamnosyltransferase